jgi:hypothetical protein
MIYRLEVYDTSAYIYDWHFIQSISSLILYFHNHKDRRLIVLLEALNS